MGTIRLTIIVECEMCARTWSLCDENEVCDMSYVGTHLWKRYPDEDDLVMWVYATDLLRIKNKKQQEKRPNVNDE
jgi:hypothetical protein